MSRTNTWAVALTVYLSTLPLPATEVRPRPPELPLDLETELALSALPPHLRDQATVYTLSSEGTFELSREGSNGFHAFVSRLDPNAFHGDWPHTQYRDDILLPIAFDAAGSKAHMKVFFDLAELRAAGTTASALKALVLERYETGHYSAPERAGISYMLSPVVRTYVDPESSDAVATWNVPHYMFYAPGISNEDIGGKFMSEHPFLLNREPGPHGYIIQVAGQAEKQAITTAQAPMIDRLCALSELYCLPEQKN